MEILTSKAYRFAEDVLAGKIVSGKKRKQACKRFLDDLEKSGQKDYPWRFDIKSLPPIEFMERF